MTIKEILKKVDTFNEIAVDFGRDKINATIFIDDLTSYKIINSKDFFKILKEEWTEMFINELYKASFELTGCGNFTRFETSFTVKHLMLKDENYTVEIDIND